MKSIKLNFFYNVVLNVTRVLFPLITAPYVARVLSPEGLGLVNFSGTYTNYFAMFALLGIPTHGLREIAKVRDDRASLSRVTSELFSLSYILTLIVSVAFFMTVLFVDRIHNDALIFLVTGLGLYFVPLDVSWYFNGVERFGFITLRHLVVRIVAIISIFAFVHTKDDMLIYIIVNTLCGVFGGIWAFVLMLKDGVKVRFTLKGITRHITPSLVLFASTIAISIYTVLDTVMLGMMSDYSEVAFYNNATNISKSILAVVTSLSAVVIPRISYHLERGENDKVNGLVNTSLNAVTFLAAPATVGLCCIAPVFTPLFYGDQYYAAILPLQIMSLVILIIGLNNISSWQALIGLQKDRLFLYAVLVGAAVNVTLNSFLIPHFGSVGASVASVVAEIAVLFASICMVTRHTFVKMELSRDMIKSLSGALLLVPLALLEARFLDGWWLVAVYCTSGFLLYALAQWMMRNSMMDMFLSAAGEVWKKFVSVING